METVSISVNGEVRVVASGATLLGLLEELKIDPRTVAVELSGQVIPRSKFGQTPVQADDKVEVVRFVQGG